MKYPQSAIAFAALALAVASPGCNSEPPPATEEAIQQYEDAQSSHASEYAKKYQGKRRRRSRTSGLLNNRRPARSASACVPDSGVICHSRFLRWRVGLVLQQAARGAHTSGPGSGQGYPESAARWGCSPVRGGSSCPHLGQALLGPLQRLVGRSLSWQHFAQPGEHLYRLVHTVRDSTDRGVVSSLLAGLCVLTHLGLLDAVVHQDPLLV